MNPDSNTFSTGLWDLDQLLEGGFLLPHAERRKRMDGKTTYPAGFHGGIVVLVKGQPGAGKTTLALQVAAGLSKSLRFAFIPSRSLMPYSSYYSLEQKPCDLREKISIMTGSALRKVLLRIKVPRDKVSDAADLQAFNSVASSIFLGIKRAIETLEDRPTDAEAPNPETFSLRLLSRGIKEIEDRLRRQNKTAGADWSKICGRLSTFGNDLRTAISADLTERRGQLLEEIEESLRDYPIQTVGGAGDRESRVYNDPNPKISNIVESLCGGNLVFREAKRTSSPEQTYGSPDTLSRALSIVDALAEAVKDRWGEKGGDRPIHPVVVVDGLNILSKDERERLGVKRVIDQLTDLAHVTILVYEPMIDEEAFLDYKADLVFELIRKTPTGSADQLRHYLSITKARHQTILDGIHEYKIAGWGIDIYPSIHAKVRSRTYLYEQLVDSQMSIVDLRQKGGLEQRPSQEGQTGGSERSLLWETDAEGFRDKGSVLERILGGIRQGSATVVFGPRRNLKSLLTLDFLCAGSRHGDKGLLVSVMDNQDTISSELFCNRICKSKDGAEPEYRRMCNECFKNISLLHLGSCPISSAQFFRLLRQRIEYDWSETVKRLVFWDLTQLECRFPVLSDDPMFLPTFLDFLREVKIGKPNREDPEPSPISSVLMSAASAKLAYSASAMADNVVFCWRDKLRNNTPLPLSAGEKQEFKKGDEVFALYVDRSEGRIMEAKSRLYCLPVPKKEIPQREKYGSDAEYSTILKSFHGDLSCVSSNFALPVDEFALPGESGQFLQNAEDEIDRITQMQGIPAARKGFGAS